MSSVGAAGPAGFPPDGPTQCKPGEPVLFSCDTGKKVASLCGGGAPSALTSITYRHGPPGKVELEYVAKTSNGNFFEATTEPASPRANVQEVWFDIGDTRYLMTLCAGGDCSYESGLVVRRKNKVLAKQRCARTVSDQAVFNPDMVDFGSSPADTKSSTPLLKIVEADNDVGALYPTKSAY